MAYVPPHKRMSSSQEELPTEAQLQYVIQSAKHHNLGQGSSSITNERTEKIHPSYAYNAISRRFTIGFTEDQHFPPLRLHTVSVDEDLVNLKQGEKAMALLKPSLFEADSERSGREDITKPWEQMVEAFLPDLLLCFDSVRKEIQNERFDPIEPKFVARAGTFLYLRKDRTDELISEASLSKLRGTFYADVPSSYMDNIMDNVVPRIGFQYRETKDVFYVTLLDRLRILRRGPAISCKCRVVEGEKRLEVYKVDLKPLRHMVFDVSCLEKNVDLRLMLSTKKTLTSLAYNERKSIEDLIGSAILDPTAEGGLRWPLDKTKSSDNNRYQVIRVCHAVTEHYSNSSMRLKVRVAENSRRLSSSSFSGEAKREMTLELKGISSLLLEKQLETDAILDMLKDEMKLLWEHFLHSEKHFIM